MVVMAWFGLRKTDCCERLILDFTLRCVVLSFVLGLFPFFLFYTKQKVLLRCSLKQEERNEPSFT